MKTLTISVDEHQASLLEGAVAEGKYASDSEMIAAALKLWERSEAVKDAETAFLRAEYDAGLASGEPKPLNRNEFFAAARSRLAARDQS